MRATYSRVPEINILPEEYRWRPLTRLQAVFLLVALLGLLLAYVPYQALATGREEVSALRAEQRRLLAAADELAPQAKRTEGLRQEIAQLRGELETTRKGGALLSIERLNWDGLFPPLFLSLPQGIELSFLSQEGQVAKIEGRSDAGYLSLTRYYEQLRALPVVAQVTLNEAKTVEEKTGHRFLSFKLTIKFKAADLAPAKD